MTITIKIGSNVLTRKDGSLSKSRMAQLVSQISAVRALGHQIILVSSGAVAAGRSVISSPKHNDTVSQRQLWSAIGQAQLINIYSDLFDIYDIKCAQLLVTKDDFRDRKHYLNLTNCLDALLEEGVVPIVNENDAISVTELMFTDNDELSGMMAAMSGSEKLLILTNVDGVFNGHPNDADSQLIRSIAFDAVGIEDNIQTTKSNFGRGGMVTKFTTAKKMASQGIEVIIANGTRDGIIVSVLQDDDLLCTRFEACKMKSPVKKWIAQSEGFEKGSIVVSAKAIDALTAPRANSLLPVGVLGVKGEFFRGDVVRIEGVDGERIGLGRSAMSSTKLKEVMGKKGERYVVHYDYLFLDN